MKKLVLSLLTAATLATASNAMALVTNDIYSVSITTGGTQVQTMAGLAFFDFDSEYFNTPVISSTPGATLPPVSSGVFPGSCVYSLQWLDALGSVPITSPPGLGPLGLTSQAWVAEQMSHGNGSCLENATMPVPSIVTLADMTVYGASTGFNQFAQMDTISALSLGETPWPMPLLTGVIQFSSAWTEQNVFGINFKG